MTIINASSGYNSLKLDKKLSYLTTFACEFHRYSFTRQAFEVVPAGDMFPYKVREIFKDMPNIFGIGDDILIVRYDAGGRDKDRTLRQVM